MLLRMADDRLTRAKELYEQAVFGGEAAALATADRALDGVEADLALARGRIVHARFLADRQEDPGELALFERAARLYGQLGDLRGEAEALFWVGTFYQVIRDDYEAGLPALQRSYELAAQAGDRLTLSYAARHLGFAAAVSGDHDTARDRLTESVRLRREIGFQPGVAAGLLALADLASRTGDGPRARELVDEAQAVAEASGAHGILRWIGEARTELETRA
jgi:tetratricopeptide (TPR) repeat protein